MDEGIWGTPSWLRKPIDFDRHPPQKNCRTVLKRMVVWWYICWCPTVLSEGCQPLTSLFSLPVRQVPFSRFTLRTLRQVQGIHVLPQVLLLLKAFHFIIVPHQPTAEVQLLLSALDQNGSMLTMLTVAMKFMLKNPCIPAISPCLIVNSTFWMAIFQLMMLHLHVSRLKLHFCCFNLRFHRSKSFVLVHFDSSVQQMSCVNPNSSWLNLHFLMAYHHVWLKMGSAPSKNMTSNIHQPWDVYRFSSIFRQTNSLQSKIAIESWFNHQKWRFSVVFPWFSVGKRLIRQLFWAPSCGGWFCVHVPGEADWLSAASSTAWPSSGGSRSSDQGDQVGPRGRGSWKWRWKRRWRIGSEDLMDWKWNRMWFHGISMDIQWDFRKWSWSFMGFRRFRQKLARKNGGSPRDLCLANFTFDTFEKKDDIYIISTIWIVKCDTSKMGI